MLINFRSLVMLRITKHNKKINNEFYWKENEL